MLLFVFSFSRTLSGSVSSRGILLHTYRNRIIRYYTDQSWCFWPKGDQWPDARCLKTSMVNILSDVEDTCQTFATAYQLLFLPFSCIRCRPRSTSGSNNQAVYLNGRIVSYISPASFEAGELLSNMADFLFPGRCHLDFFIVFSTNHRA